MRRYWLLGATAGLLLGSATLPPPPAAGSVGVLPAFEPVRLLSFESLWEDTSLAVPPEPRVKIVISLSQQRAYVFRDEELVATAPVSTGKRGKETPVGTFRILQKKVHHRSNLYSNAPMPYMQRLTWSGIALHAGDLPGYPASHGCIRLPWSVAKRLYGLTDFTTEVTVTRSRPESAEQALKLA